jgi:hypothetical protein
MDKYAIFPSSELCNSQQLYHSHLLLVQNYHTENSDWQWWATGEGNYTWGWKGASTSDHKTRKMIPSMNQLKSPDTKHNTDLCNVRKFTAVCVPLKKKNEKEIKVMRMQHTAVCYNMFWAVSHKTAFWVESLSTQMGVNITTVITESIFFSSNVKMI